jgi:hypothetical protein
VSYPPSDEIFTSSDQQTGLIGIPINGQLLSEYGYLALSFFSGASILLGMIVAMVARLKIDRRLLSDFNR